MHKILFATFVLLVPMLHATEVGKNDYKSEIAQWREKRENGLKVDGGWLTVTGLYWLKQGNNTLGSDAANDIVLPEGSPANFGAVTLEGDKLAFETTDATVKLDGKALAGKTELHVGGGRQEVLSSGAIQLLPLKRGERFALRLKDNNSRLRSGFTGLNWFPVHEEWRIQARFTAFPADRKLTFDSVIGETEVMDSPGYVTFEYGGKSYQLQAAGTTKRLFFVLRDQTSGKSTYAAARFLYSAVEADGSVVLDFNKAENPPCAFTPYATCPLPPPQNRLNLAVTAGEQAYHGSGH